MSTPRVKISFRSFKDAELVQKTEHILQSMTGNADFASPIPSLVAVKAAKDKYSIALGKALDGTKQDTSLKNQARADLEGLLHDLAMYVQLNGKGDEAIIISSGFDLAKTPAPVGILSKPYDFSVANNGRKGCIDLSLYTISGAKTYLYEYTEAPASATSVWHIITDTAASITIKGLQSGKEYAFRVAGVGSDPTRVYSDVIMSFVL